MPCENNKGNYLSGGNQLILIVLGTLSDFEKDLLNKIYKENNIKLFHIAFGILRSHTDAEEAVSSAFLKIIEHIEKISKLPCPQIAPYCIVIVKNEAFSIIRRKKKEPAFEDLEYLSDYIDDTDSRSNSRRESCNYRTFHGNIYE